MQLGLKLRCVMEGEMQLIEKSARWNERGDEVKCHSA
jgi:hypothetical protein